MWKSATILYTMEPGVILIGEFTPGETVTVFAVADAGYELAEESLKYYTEESVNGTAVKDGVFVMPLGNVTIKAKFLKKTEIADKKELNAAIEQAKHLVGANYTPER